MAFYEFSRLIQDVVVRDDEGMRELALRLGKRQASLLREVNPRDRRAKLGVDTLLRIMELRGDVRPLEYMARQMGLRLERLSEGTEDAVSAGSRGGPSHNSGPSN